MAGKQNENQEKTGGKRKFKAVQETIKIKGGALRQLASSRVRPSGRTLLNVEATEAWDQLVIGAGYDPKGLVVVKFAADTETGQAAAYPVPHGTKGAIAVRRTDENTVVLHMGGVFKKHAELRISRTLQCNVETDIVDTDEETDKPALIISLKTGVDPRQRRNRTQAPVEEPEPDDEPGAEPDDI